MTYAPAVGVTSADRAVIVRELARAAARVLGHRISFSPAVTSDVVGNGVHVHMSLVDLAGRTVMYDADAPHGLSEIRGPLCRRHPAPCGGTVCGDRAQRHLLPAARPASLERRLEQCGVS